MYTWYSHLILDTAYFDSGWDQLYKNNILVNLWSERYERLGCHSSCSTSLLSRDNLTRHAKRLAWCHACNRLLNPMGLKKPPKNNFSITFYKHQWPGRLVHVWPVNPYIPVMYWNAYLVLYFYIWTLSNFFIEAFFLSRRQIYSQFWILRDTYINNTENIKNMKKSSRKGI